MSLVEYKEQKDRAFAEAGLTLSNEDDYPTPKPTTKGNAISVRDMEGNKSEKADAEEINIIEPKESMNEIEEKESSFVNLDSLVRKPSIMID